MEMINLKNYSVLSATSDSSVGMTKTDTKVDNKNRTTSTNNMLRVK